MGKWKALLSLAGVFVIFLVVGLVGHSIYFANKEVVEKTAIIRVNDMMSNLTDGAMIKLSISVVVNASVEGNNSEDILRDVLISHLRTVSKPDLDGVVGLDYLRSNLLSSAKHALGAENIKEIFVREFIVQ